MFKAYYRPPKARTANGDKTRNEKLTIGIKVPGGRRELLTTAQAVAFSMELDAAIKVAATQE